MRDFSCSDLRDAGAALMDPSRSWPARMANVNADIQRAYELLAQLNVPPFEGNGTGLAWDGSRIMHTSTDKEIKGCSAKIRQQAHLGLAPFLRAAARSAPPRAAGSPRELKKRGFSARCEVTPFFNGVIARCRLFS